MAGVIELGPNRYVSADTIPAFAAARSEVRAGAHQILESRHQQILTGNYEGIPLAVDALTTAQRANQNKAVYGERSEEYREAYGGLFLDCHRLLAEWRRKNTSEYFPLVRHTYDEASGEYYSHGVSIWEMTGDALTPVAHPEEADRRVNERVEEGTAMAVRKIGGLALGQTVRMRTVSECPDWSIDALKEGSKNGFGGTVPEIEKLMVRDMVFDIETNDRFEEQVGLPGTYIKHDIITKAIGRRGIQAENLSKTELHGTQLFVQDDLIDFIELLDNVASEEWCVEIYLGEVLKEGQTKDYAGIREAAIARQEELKGYAHTVAGFVMDLEKQGTDHHAAPALVEEFVKKILINMADRDNSLAIEMFDEPTAQGLQEVAYLRSIGLAEEAFARLNEVEAAAPGGGYCGAGSCGLERVLPGSNEAKSIEDLGFNPKDSLVDKERKCVKCSRKSVVYDLEKGKKGCTSCKATTKYKP